MADRDFTPKISPILFHITTENPDSKTVFFCFKATSVRLVLNNYFTYVVPNLFRKDKKMKKDFDYKKYQITKTKKKINARKYKESKEYSTKFTPSTILIDGKRFTTLEATDHMEIMQRAEMLNRSSAISKLIAERKWGYTRVTMTYATENRVENNFKGYEKSADDYLLIQKDSLHHFIDSVIRKFKKKNKNLEYKYNIEVQLLNGVNLHAHVIFYHPQDSELSCLLFEIISYLRYAIKNKKIKIKKRYTKILSLGRIYIQMSSLHQETIVNRYKLISEQEIYNKLNMTKPVDTKADNYASYEENVERYRNYTTGSWVWISFLPTEDMNELQKRHDMYDNKAFHVSTITELSNHLQHDTKALIQDTSKMDKTLTAEFIVEHITNDFCKNFVNNAILEDLNIKRVSMSHSLLFPIDIYRKCRKQLIDYDDGYEDLYFTTKQLENGEIRIENNSLQTKIIDVETELTIAKFNKKKTL